MKIFQERLKRSREKRKVSQRALSLISGLSCSAISHFEHGRRLPSLKNLCCLADSLSVTTDYLSGKQNEFIAAGPLIKQLYNKISKLPEIDLNILADMADRLMKI